MPPESLLRLGQRGVGVAVVVRAWDFAPNPKPISQTGEMRVRCELRTQTRLAVELRSERTRRSTAELSSQLQSDEITTLRTSVTTARTVQVGRRTDRHSPAKKGRQRCLLRPQFGSF